MKIAFANFTPLNYTVETPRISPLGGSESAMCYLAESLANLGHDIILFTHTNNHSVIRDVHHFPISLISSKNLKSLDYFILQNTPDVAPEIKALLPKSAKLIFWSQHAFDQPAVANLKKSQIINSFSAIVTISHWQRQTYLKYFPIPSAKCYILRNAIAPAFENLFPPNQHILIHKLTPPLIAYTSTPFRGLDLLLKIFPTIKSVVPDVRLQIFSSLAVYQQTSSQYDKLFELCRQTPGVEVIGSISQTELAQRLKPVLILTYPNTFPETSCISVMEAMAAGCQIVTSNLGALPETSAGFGSLINPNLDEPKYLTDFANKIIKFLIDFKSVNSQYIDDNLIRQTYFANQAYTWQKRAQEWELLLSNL